MKISVMHLKIQVSKHNLKNVVIYKFFTKKKYIYRGEPWAKGQIKNNHLYLLAIL